MGVTCGSVVQTLAILHFDFAYGKLAEKFANDNCVTMRRCNSHNCELVAKCPSCD